VVRQASYTLTTHTQGITKMSINITKIIKKPLGTDAITEVNQTLEVKQSAEVKPDPKLLQALQAPQAPKPTKPVQALPSPQAPKPVKPRQPKATVEQDAKVAQEPQAVKPAQEPQAEQTPISSEPKSATETETETSPQTEIFQAIGVITGDIAFIKDEQKDRYIANITIGNNTYNLLPQESTWAKKASFIGLRKEIEVTGVTRYKLVVYPQITHYPGKEQPHRVAFQLVAFEKTGVENGLSAEFNDLEFKLSGLWQFIPVCQTPCITIMRNFSEDRLTYIKQAELASKVNFMKASHVPLIWRDSPVKPFRFNPKLEKEQQGKSMFVSIKARFIPGRDVFGFDSMLGVPQDEPPKHLKAGKKDKAEVLKSKLANKKTQKSWC